MDSNSTDDLGKFISERAPAAGDYKATPASYVQLPPGGNGSTSATLGEQILVAGPCTLHGWTVEEWSGAADFNLDIYDGTVATGNYLGSVRLGAAEVGVEWFIGGISIRTALHVNLTYGTAIGAFFYS